MKRWEWGFVLALGLAGAAQAAELRILSGDQWCPHNCAPDDAQPGYLIELARAALALHGVQVEYRTGNFSRLVAEVERGEAQHALVALGRSPRMERLFVLGPQALGRSPMCFFVRRDSTWRYRGPDSLPQVRLGVTQGYGYQEDIDAYVAAPEHRARVNKVGGDEPIQRHLTMLMAGRSGAVIEDEAAMRWALRKLGLQGDVKEAGCLTTEDDGLYIGFARSDPLAERHARWLARGLQQLRRSGEWARIMARYGLQVPPAKPRGG